MKDAVYGLLLGLLLGGALSLWTYGYGKSVVEARHIAALQEAQAKNVELQKALMKGVEKVAEDANKEQLDIEQRLVGADNAVERLREAVRRADSSSATFSAAIANAARARALLAECSEKYRDVAKQADQLRANVLGLQAYVNAIKE